jgi:hypothetical protein
MGQNTQLTVLHRVNRQLPGYEKMNLYVVREPYNFYTGTANECYLLTEALYANGEKIWADLGPDNTEPYKNNKSGYLDGMRIYVIRPSVMTLSGHFNVRATIPATAPEDTFANAVVKRSEYYLYNVDHVDQNGVKTGRLFKVYSKVHYFKGETIPIAETQRLYHRYPSEQLEYFIQDHDKYLKRAVAAFGLRKK